MRRDLLCAIAITLAAWSLSHGQASAQWAPAPDELVDAAATPGTIMIIGGGVNEPATYDEFFRLAGGAQSRVLHIPSATVKFEKIVSLREYYEDWFNRPHASFGFLHTRSREEAMTEAFAEPLRHATGVWIGGGDQNTLMDLYADTPVTRELRALLARGGVIAGTSSGAAIVSNIMVRDETALMCFLRPGFGLCPAAIVDPHLTGRERLPRLMDAVRLHPDHISVGVDEQTVLLLHAGQMSVMGRGVACFLSCDGRTGVVTRRVLAANAAAPVERPLTIFDELTTALTFSEAKSLPLNLASQRQDAIGLGK